MRKLFDKIRANKALQALVLFIPFTGIIHPDWYAIIFFVYFILGGYYYFLHE